MNRDRIVNLAVVVALAAAVAWIAMHTYWAEVTVPTPLQGEAASNLYYSLERLLGSLGMRTRHIGSLRTLPPSGSLLINELQDGLLQGRLGSLESWVQSGGRLIIWGDTLWSSGELQTWSGIAPSHRDRPTLTRGVRIVDFGPDENCPPMSVRIDGRDSGESLRVCGATAEFAFDSKRLPSWSLSDAQGMQVLRVSIGRGEFTVIGPRQIIGNRALLIGDHAQVFIDAARLRRGAELLILSPAQAEPLPALLWRLAAPAVMFLAAALLALIWRHWPRFGPPMPIQLPVRRSLAEQIRANARFAWRTRKLGSLRAAVRRSLDETALTQIAGFSSLNARQRASALAARTGVESNALNAALTGDAAGSVQVQHGAIALLEACRRILDQANPTKKRYAHDR